MRYTLLLFIILFPNISFSQSKFNALINSSNHKPIDEVYVMAYKDSSFEDPFFAGSFDINKIQFNIPESLDCFFIRVSNLEYELYEEEICKPFEDKYEIILQERHYELNAVMIKGFEKTEIRVEGSVAEIRPGHLLSNNSALTAENVMKSLPEVLISPQENILVRGREIEKIFLYTTPNSPKTEISFSELNTIPAEQIESIKIDYLLSEISLHLKKIKLQGIATNSRLRQYQGRKAYTSLAQDLRLNKGNTYYWLDLQAGTIDTKPVGNSKYLISIPEDETIIANTNSRMKQKYFGSKLFIEHKFDSIYSGGLQLTYNIQESPNETQLNANIGVANTMQSFLNNKSNAHSLAPSLFLQGNYSNGWTLSLKAGILTSLQKADNLGEFNSSIANQDITNSQVLHQRIKTNAYTSVLEGIKQWQATSLNISVKGNYLDNKTDSDYHQVLIGQTPVDSVFTNQIKEYKLEMETSVQTLLWEKYILRATSNITFYNYSFYDTDSEKLTQNKLARILPGFSISAPIKEAKYLTFYGNSYMRSPNFQNLIFRNMSGDGFSENRNNYKLKPFTSYQLGLSYPILPNTITSVYWSTTDNMNINYPYFSDTGVFEGNRKINLSDSQNIGLSLNYSKTFWRKLDLSVNVNGMYNSWKNKEEYAFKTNFINVLSNANLNYSSNTNWFFNLDYTYSSKQKLSENIELRNNSLLNFSVSKKINNSWAVFLKINDLLNSYKLETYALNHVLYESVMRPDQRQITLGINYGFNKGFKQKQPKQNLMDDLNQRIRVNE